MARKGNQQRNGVGHTSNFKRKVSDPGHATPDMKGRGKASEVKVFPGEETPNGSQPSSLPTDHKYKQTSEEYMRKEEHGTDQQQDEVPGSSSNISGNCSSPFVESPGVRRENRAFPGRISRPKHAKNGLNYLLDRLHIKKMLEHVQFSGNTAARNLRTLTLPILKAAGEWLERQGPLFAGLTTNVYNVHDYVKQKVEQAYPVVLKWLINIGNIMLLLSVVWLDFTLRGIDSFLRLGTTSFFSVIWCSILSVIAMVGFLKFLFVLAIAAFVGLFIGLTLGLLIVAISGAVFLWLYGSFWTTVFVIFMGGLAFMLSHERLALFVTTVYSIYCAWTFVGWLGLLLALNLSFVSSDVLVYFLKNNVNQHGGRSNRFPEQSAGVDGEPGFSTDESFYASFSDTSPGLSSDRSPGVPSTSGADSELTSEEEVIRLLNCTDHYSALGFSRYENVDVSLLKREYRKKAMLVHPDKNMGNEKAAEAFKKLQNAYEVLLDSSKRKAYDDELRREELLNYFRRSQSISRKNGEHSFFASCRSEAEVEDPFRESRHIACKRCNNFHFWVHTSKSKSQARWCQDCKELHQAKDGDGWVEQSSQPFFFGLLQKVDAPTAYVCADSKIYDATEWYICQGMRCPANTHKPSFHVNTSVTNKHNTGKGPGSGPRRGSNMEETMTEEEFFEWFQSAMQAGIFGGGTSSESPPSKAGNGGPKGSSGSGSGSGSGNSNTSSNKRKKKGKKQW